jgi:hypothetical protein
LSWECQAEQKAVDDDELVKMGRENFLLAKQQF